MEAFTLVNLLVVSDVRIYREGLQEVLVSNDQVEVVAAASSMMQALGYLEELNVEVGLLDVGTADALVLTKEIAIKYPQVKVVAFGLTNCMRDVLMYAEAGISGYVSKDACVAELVSAIVRTHQGKLSCSDEIAGALIQRVSMLARMQATPTKLDELTPREFQIAELLSQGLSNHEIASALQIRLATTKTHVHHILEKLRVRRRGQVSNYLHRRLSEGTNL